MRQRVREIWGRAQCRRALNLTFTRALHVLDLLRVLSFLWHPLHLPAAALAASWSFLLVAARGIAFKKRNEFISQLQYIRMAQILKVPNPPCILSPRYQVPSPEGSSW